MKNHRMVIAHGGFLLTLWMPGAAARAQEQPVATVATEGVQLKNVLSVANGRASLGGNSGVTAGDATADVTLVRGGSLLVCTGTTVQIARAQSAAAPQAAGTDALMFSLDRGAFETDYKPSAEADVVMTPDLRVLIAAPGVARLKLRVNAQGDTCIDNAGDDAPYVVVSSLMSGGVYRVRPGQRVLLVGGSLDRVVDNEKEPCGCPAPTPPADAHASSAAAANPFPAAVSEGLQPPAPAPTVPVVPEGTPHAQVQATLSSNTPPEPQPSPLPEPTSPAPQATAPSQPAPHHRGFFGSVGHFFAKVFGAD